jgi:serine/threonine protein kinase
MGNTATKVTFSPTKETQYCDVSVGSASLNEVSVGSTSTRSVHPDLHDNLMRTTNRDPMKYYDLLEILGVGSMGTVAKVKKKTTAVGGSAREAFRDSERTTFFGISCCGGKEQKKKNAIDTVRPPYIKKSSSIITYGTKKDSYFALKSILLERAANETYVEELKNEIAILKTLDHPSIVRPLETFSFKNQLYILMELCDGGDLYSRDPCTFHTETGFAFDSAN